MRQFHDQADPRSKYSQDGAHPQEDIGQPGLIQESSPAPDHGEQSWIGHGRLPGKRALITGGDSGIGKAVAVAFAREGADVAFVHLPEENEDAEETAKLVREAGRHCAHYAVDLTGEEAPADVVRRAIEDLSGLDVLVLNAGYQRAHDGIEDISAGHLRRVFETNIISHTLIVREAVPHLQPGSSIISTTSIQAEQPKPALFDYAMTKASQRAFTESMAVELGHKGIRVNAVAPGPIWTPLIPGTGFSDVSMEEFGTDTPLGRPGQPAELAGAYVYLASEEASYVSGAILPVPGGKGF